ncbi:MAG: hypothetical protein B1H11_06465 [Desulfobacteraceae bacterium 4484_190.1]|nr:hypothetical protein [Deltaproteobacteria bacterium]OPX37045.1 MAG: hypothetical protein B1H11_06465 [Desulfobacteraceae bacterium 4484_190.1]
MEKRTEPRNIIDKYYSVEFSINEVPMVYQFKIWDISSKGICILIKEDSALLEHIKIGDILELKYYTFESLKPAEYIKTEISHMTRDDSGRFQGHYLVGISILET